MAKCLECEHASGGRGETDPRRASIMRRMARAGALNCLLSVYKATFRDAMQEHACKKFSPVTGAALDARREWASAQQKTGADDGAKGDD